MKNVDYILWFAAILICSLAIGTFVSRLFVLKLIVGIYTMIMLIYWKLYPYRNQLGPKYQRLFMEVDKSVRPIWDLFKKIPNITLGPNLSMEAAPFITCAILLIILICL